MSYPARSGVQLKNGWDTFRGSKTPGICVEADEVSDKGQSRTVRYIEVTDASSFMTALSVSAEAKVSALLGGGGSASASFSKTVTLDTTGLNLVVDLKILQGARYLVPSLRATAQQYGGSTSSAAGPTETSVGSIRLTPQAVALAAQDPVSFREQCGDAFVSTIRMGHGIQGAYVIKTRGESERVEFSGKVSGSYGPFSGSVEAQRRIQALESESRVAIYYFQLGAPGLPIATNDKEFQALVQSIGATATQENATAFEIGLIRYGVLINHPKYQEFDRADLEAMADQYYRLYSLDAQINEMLTKDEYFFDRKVSLESLRAAQNAVKHDIRTLYTALKSCASSPATCKYPNDISRNDYSHRAKLPVRKDQVNDWNRVQQAKADLLVAERNLIWARLTSLISMVNRALASSLEQRVAGLKEKIATIEASADSTQERFKVWIEFPSRARCKAEEHNLCLDNDQLNAMSRKMIE